MTQDETKLHNLLRLCKRDNIALGADLGRKLGYKGDSAKSMGNAIKSGKRKITGEVLKKACELFNVEEDEFLKPIGNDEKSPAQHIDLNILMKIIDEQKKRIEEQGKRIDEQGDRISEQGKRIDVIADMVKEDKSEHKSMLDSIRSMQEVLNTQHGKMKKAAENGDLTALGD